VNACGADFAMLGTETMLKSRKPVVAVTAVRTGCGKSQTTRKVCDILKKHGKKVVVARHPMPYGDLKKQACQRFASFDDLEKQKCTVEEREEYEPLLERGIIVYAGVDYEKILKCAEKEANIIVWDGGNNDIPFFKPNFWVVLTDALRPYHEILYYPGEVNLRMADAAIINKAKDAKQGDVEIILSNIKKYNRKAEIIIADSAITVSNPLLIKDKKALVVEDGPSLTHGELPFGAGFIAAKQFDAEIIDPRPYAVGSIKAVYDKYKHLYSILPAMGYSPKQIKELEKTINKVPCDIVVSATPIDLRRILRIRKPIVRIKYELDELSGKTLERSLIKKLRL
jgi:predicted GTPase